MSKFIGPAEEFDSHEFRSRHPNSGYLYNWRDKWDPMPDCHCPDSASWPTPKLGKRIEEDPLADFIKGYHDWKRGQGG